MYAKTIISCSFPKAWEEAVKFVINSPEQLTFGGGKEVKHAIYSQTTIILDKHAIQDVLNKVVHPSDPFATPAKLKAYMDEYTDEYDASKFDYTYYNILKEGFNTFSIDEKYSTLDEEKIIGQLKNNCYVLKTPFNQIVALRNGLQKQVDEKLSSNRNVAVLWNPIIHTYSNKAQPCWNEVMVQWVGEGKARIYWTFRSHDLFGAWEGNTVAMVDFLNREVVKPCGCEIVEVCEFNYFLHIYSYNLDEANKIKTVSINPMLTRLQEKYDSLNNPSIFDEVLYGDKSPFIKEGKL